MNAPIAAARLPWVCVHPAMPAPVAVHTTATAMTKIVRLAALRTRVPCGMCEASPPRLCPLVLLYPPMSSEFRRWQVNESPEPGRGPPPIQRCACRGRLSSAASTSPPTPDLIADGLRIPRPPPLMPGTGRGGDAIRPPRFGAFLVRLVTHRVLHLCPRGSGESQPGVPPVAVDPACVVSGGAAHVSSGSYTGFACGGGPSSTCATFNQYGSPSRVRGVLVRSRWK